MKKILILIVAIALYLHFYPNPEINKWYEGKKAEFLDTMAKSTKVTFKSNLDELYNQLKKDSKGFSAIELENLRTITGSLDSLNDFYQNNCSENSKSSLFHPDNISKVCKKLSTAISQI